jgi:EAL domain-containing protein (putative c-di-GMP-specific phosphodiesterase class I)
MVAEGIERESQSKLLLDLGCVLGQGFHYFRPLPAREIERLCAAAKAPPATSLESGKVVA